MKSRHKLAIAILGALSFGVAASAHAQPGGMGGMGPGMKGQMMQGHNMGGGQHGGMGAGQQGHGGPGQQGATGPHQHGGAGAGPMAGGCPMMAQHSAQSGHKH